MFEAIIAFLIVRKCIGRLPALNLGRRLKRIRGPESESNGDNILLQK
jgi:hypothetical protein